MDFNNVVDRYGTFCTQWDYVSDRFGRAGILPFTISDMDFATPKEITAQLSERLEHSVFGYTRWNHQEFKGAIQRWFEERFATKIEAEHIVYSPSVIYTISELLTQVSEEGDHVIVQTPCYDGFFQMIEAKKRKLVANPLVKKDGYFYFDYEDLEQKLQHEKAKVLLLCSPHNPTGRVWKEDELKQLIVLCQKYKVWIIADEIHMDIVYAPNRHIPIVQVANGVEEICLCTSASKTFNTSGLGGSYVIIPKLQLKEQFLMLSRASGLSMASIFGMHSLMAGYNECAPWVDSLCAYIKGNMEFVRDYLAKNIQGAKFIIPEATYLAWIDVSNFRWTMDELQAALVQKEQVAFMDGAIYGAEDYLRINVAAPRSKIEAGMEHFRKAVAYLE